MAMTEGGLRLERPRPQKEQKVCQALKEAMISGKLKPNQRLIAGSFAAEIGASRTPVREAMLKLELEGAVSKAVRRPAAAGRSGAGSGQTAENSAPGRIFVSSKRSFELF